MDLFRQAITKPSICNKVFRNLFLNPDTLAIIPRWDYRMGDRQSVESLYWLAYVGRTRNNVTWAGNGREVYLARIPNMKIDRYCWETNDVFEYLGCPCMPNRHKPTGNTEETLLSRYEEIMARLQKIRDAGYNVSIWGTSLVNRCAKIQALKMNSVRTPIWRTLPLIFGVEPKRPRHGTELSKGKKSAKWMLSVCTP